MDACRHAVSLSQWEDTSMNCLSYGETEILDYLTNGSLVSVTLYDGLSRSEIYGDGFHTGQFGEVFLDHSLAMAARHSFYENDSLFFFHFV